jgi:hypothetical protein
MCDLFGVRKYLEWSLIFDLGSMQMTFDPCKYLRVRFYWRTRRCQHCFSIALRSGAPDGRFIAVRADNWTVYVVCWAIEKQFINDVWETKFSSEFLSWSCRCVSSFGKFVVPIDK